jgi:hypothetical protein
MSAGDARKLARHAKGCEAHRRRKTKGTQSQSGLGAGAHRAACRRPYLELFAAKRSDRGIAGVIKPGSSIRDPWPRGVTSLVSLNFLRSSDAAFEGRILCDGQWQGALQDMVFLRAARYGKPSVATENGVARPTVGRGGVTSVLKSLRSASAR